MHFFTNIFLKVCRRGISTSVPCNGKRNFRKFLLYNKRGSRVFKQSKAAGNEPEVPVYTRGVREIGYKVGRRFVIVPEMIPELIVPDLTDFQLKPYVSYRVPEVHQTEFNDKDLFDAVYSSKIVEELKSGKLDENDNMSEVFATPEDAWREARKTGSDIF